jgi:replicative DNA helicase
MTSERDRIPPQDMDAERALLGSLMLGGLLTETPLKSADFVRSAHGVVFDAITALQVADEPVDVITVAAKLESSGKLEDVGGKCYLLDMDNAGTLASHAEQYARIVVGKSRLRDVIRVATDAIADAYSSGDGADEVIGRAADRMLALQDTGRMGSERASDAVARRLKDYANPTPAVSLPGTGTRLHFGDVCVLGGRPGTGKTAIALQAADTWRKDHKVLVLSFEMSTGELADRLIARATCKSSELAYSGLSESEQVAYGEACAGILADEHLELVQATGMSEAQTTARIRAFAAAGGQIVVLDYLQIAAESRTDENADLTRFMRALQRVAKRSGVCLLALSQYSRGATDGKPALHHLRGSGSIEQEAATVCLMWSPESDDQATRKAELAAKGYILDPGDPRLLIRLAWQKVRHGAPATDYFLFDGATMRLEPAERVAQEHGPAVAWRAVGDAQERSHARHSGEA